MLAASYVSDWLCLIAAGLVGTFLGNITPNKRPFRVDDPNIAYVTDRTKHSFTAVHEHEVIILTSSQLSFHGA
jgi:hypothetical protein